jgi:hypothetical protein
MCNCVILLFNKFEYLEKFSQLSVGLGEVCASRHAAIDERTDRGGRLLCRYNHHQRTTGYRERIYDCFVK